MKNNFYFLNEKQVIGEEKLDVFKLYGTKSEITDFALLLGGTNEFDSISNKRMGSWWTNSPYYSNEIYTISGYGNKIPVYPYIRNVSIRPCINYETIKKYSKKINMINNVATIYYGEYPQQVVDLDYSYELESAFNMHLMKPTNKEYTVDFNGLTDYSTSFVPKSYTEFIYKDKKYIRYIANIDGIDKLLSDGRRSVYSGIYWLEVSPIIWYVDNDIAISKKAIVSGLQYNDRAYVHKHFNKNNIKIYMDDYLSKEVITCNKVKKLIKE